MPPNQDAGAGKIINDPTAEFGGLQPFFKHKGLIAGFKSPGGQEIPFLALGVALILRAVVMSQTVFQVFGLASVGFSVFAEEQIGIKCHASILAGFPFENVKEKGNIEMNRLKIKSILSLIIFYGLVLSFTNTARAGGLPNWTICNSGNVDVYMAIIMKPKYTYRAKGWYPIKVGACHNIVPPNWTEMSADVYLGFYADGLNGAFKIRDEGNEDLNLNKAYCVNETDSYELESGEIEGLRDAEDCHSLGKGFKLMQFSVWRKLWVGSSLTGSPSSFRDEIPFDKSWPIYPLK